MTFQQEFKTELSGKDVTVFYDETEPTNYEVCIGEDYKVLELNQAEDREIWMAVQNHLSHLEYEDSYEGHLDGTEYDRLAEDIEDYL